MIDLGRGTCPVCNHMLKAGDRVSVTYTAIAERYPLRSVGDDNHITLPVNNSTDIRIVHAECDKSPDKSWYPPDAE